MRALPPQLPDQPISYLVSSEEAGGGRHLEYWISADALIGEIETVGEYPEQS